MRLRARTLLFVPLLLALVVVGACSDDESEPEVPTTTDEAYAILEDLLFDYQETYDDLDDADAPDDYDFRPAMNAYQEAHDADPDDPTARFGLAATRLLALSADARVNEAFDDWEEYLENHTPFEVDATSRTLGLPLGLPTNSRAIHLPFDLVTCGAVAPLKTRLAAGEPLVSDVQAILLEVVLPAVDTCIALLTPVAELDDFEFIISPRMQGSEYEDPLELDRVEVMAMLAACKLLKAGIGVAAAYDVQFPSYDADGMAAGLDQDDGNVGALLPDGGIRMQQVPALFLEAVDIVDEALDVLQAEPETDPDQDDDIIKIGPSDIDQDDVDDMQAEDLPDIRAAFAAAGALRTEDWDDDGGTPPVTLRINLLNFFETPVEDFKQLLPPYDLEIVTLADDHYESGTASGVAVNIPDDVWSTSYGVLYVNGELEETWGDPYPDFQTWCDAWAASEVADLLADPAWSGYASFYFSDWESHVAGMHTITIYHSLEWFTFVSAPEIHWEAQTFADWTDAMPDPTISGLLPEMADGGTLCATFGMREDDWEPVMTFRWWEGEFDDDEPTPPPPGAPSP